MSTSWFHENAGRASGATTFIHRLVVSTTEGQEDILFVLFRAVPSGQSLQDGLIAKPLSTLAGTHVPTAVL